MKGFKLSLFLILLNLLSCKYELDEIYAPNTSKPSDNPSFIENININLPYDENLTLLIPTPVIVRLDSCDVRILKVDFYIDNEATTGFRNGNDFYTFLLPYDYKQHKFRIEIITSSGTNSIIDELGMEGYIFTTREWSYSFKKFSESSHAQSSLETEGALIKWKTYDGVNSFNYFIERPETGLQIQTQSNQFLDTNYFGETAEYNIFIKCEYGGKYLWATHKTQNDLPKPKYDFVNNRTAISWKPSIYKDKIKEYRIYNNAGYYPKLLLAVLPGSMNYFFPEDYLKCVLGLPNPIIIETVPEVNPGIDSTKYQVATNLNFGVPHKFYYKVVVNDSKGVITKDNFDLLRYHNITTGAVTELMSVGAVKISLSPDFKTLVFQPSRADYIIYNLGELHALGKYKMEKTVLLEAENTFDLSFLDLSNNGIMAKRINDSIWVYDLMNEQIIGKLKGASTDRYIISPNGEKLVIYSPSKIFTYNINNGFLSLTNTFSSPDLKIFLTSEYFRKIEGNPDIFYFFNEQSYAIDFRRYDNLALVNSIPSDYNNRFFSLDYENNRYMTSGYEMFTGKYVVYVKDLLSGEVLFTIPKDKDNLGIELDSFLSNNVVYTAGYKYILPN